MDDLTLPPCIDCDHEAKWHMDRATAACAPEPHPPVFDGEHLTWKPADKCFCPGYRVKPR